MGKKLTQNTSKSENPLVSGAGKPHNRLLFEKSPYLLQHAYNPVDWYPWGPEAFERARRENKPVFLSIGYSTCHWCHVMEHESFEDPHVAALLNDAFIPIKVDREERPDLDNIYMTVCQMITGRGGWPLTIFMTPEKKPFFAASYIPKENRYGQIGMLELIPRIRELWSGRQGEVLDSANTITAFLQQMAQGTPGEDLDESILKLAFEQLGKGFDEYHGGFGGAPKFPIPHHILFLLRYWKRTGQTRALEMAEKTLQSMRYGGIYDHIGFGFHRYSTDAEWLVPHFEKMLYDQAMLAMAYTEAYQATGKKAYGKTASEIFSYVLRDMTSPAGGFYSAEDADSQGEEGRFYLWTEDEVREILDRKEADLFVRVFAIEKAGNFVEQPTEERSGRNILHIQRSLTDMASHLKIPDKELEDRLERGRKNLFSARNRRIHPHKDDKILTDWNGLMIAALAKGAQVLDDPGLALAARGAADFILETMRTPEGRLLHRYRDGEAAIPANLDDHAFLIWGLIELYEATFDVQYLSTALDLNKDLQEHFWDEKKGGFYFTADDDEDLLVRQKEIYDGALPSGNSVATLNLIRLGRITGRYEFEEMASRIVRTFSRKVSEFPSTHTQLLVAIDFMAGPSYEVVLAGRSQAKDTEAMLHALRIPYVPNRVVLFRPVDEDSPAIIRIAPFTRDQRSIEGVATAYVCMNHACTQPTTEISTMLELLNVTKHTVS